MDQKATPITPPHFNPSFEARVVDVNMTGLYSAVAALGVATTCLTAGGVYLYRKVRKTEQSMEALSAYISHLVNDTECGSVAYQNILDGAAEEDRENGVADWSADDEDHPFPERLVDEPVES